MHENLIALLENSGFVSNGQPNVDVISKATLADIIKFSHEFSTISDYRNTDLMHSIYTHGASMSLCGGTFPCHILECRLGKAQELAQFATLYSDRVYIHNYLFDYAVMGANFELTNESIQRIMINFPNDIIVLAHMMPLIESGLIVPISFLNYCPHCLTVEALNQSSATEYECACHELENRYYSEVQYSIEPYKNNYNIMASGPDILIPHGSHNVICTQSKVKKLPKTALKQLESGVKITLTQSQARKINAGNIYIKRVLNTAAFELGSAQFLGSAFLTDSELEVEFIRGLTSDPIAKRRTALMQKYLNCIVPFIENVKPIDLIKLRNTEGEAFILFRNALNKAVEEYKTNGADFSERDAQAIYGDIVQPHLAKLDSKVKNAKKHFVKSSKAKIINLGGAISVGLYTGFLTANPLTGVAAFAAAKKCTDSINSPAPTRDAGNQLRDDDWYFLWKVKKLAQ